MAMNPNIILQGRPVNVLGALDQGTVAGARAYGVQREQQMNNALSQFGGGLVQGDRGAMNAIAAFDPGLVMDVQNVQHTMQDRDRRFDMASEEFNFRRQQAKAQAEQLIAQQAAELDMEALAREAEQDSRAAATLSTIQTPEQYARLAPAIFQSIGEEMPAFEDLGPTIAALEGGTEAAREFIEGQNPQQGDMSAAEESIARIMEVTNPVTDRPFTREEAIQLTELNRAGVDEYGNPYVITLDGRLLQGGRQPAATQAQPALQEPAQAPATPQPGNDGLSFGDRFEGGDTAFGAGGFARGVANRAADIVGAPMPFEQTDAAQADFRVLREDLVNVIASGYPRQPPSWLLQDIRRLIPEGGRILQGAQGATNDMQALLRTFDQQIEIKEGQLAGDMRPADREAVRQELSALQSGRAQLSSAVAAIQGGDGGDLPPVPDGVDPATWPRLWENMTPEDRALFQ